MGGAVGNFLDVVLSVGAVLGFAVGCGWMIKVVAFRANTPDGDSIANRMLGHGPDDEVFYDSQRTRLRNLGRRSSE
jgi:uncharacterized membrane protein